MDKEILKLLPQKAFKLLSIKETLKIGTLLTKSMFDNGLYEAELKERLLAWKFSDIQISKQHPMDKKSLSTKEDGEKVLKIYFSQFFEKNLAVHIDLRISSFSASQNPCSFHWAPSKLHYHFSPSFLEGVRLLYQGFYFEDSIKFEKGLILLGMITESMNEKQKNDIKNLFFKHFGEGKSEPVQFSLKKLQDSFNAIFSFFLKEDVPLNPEFAVLGINLVTLYLTLQEIPHELNVAEIFCEVSKEYENSNMNESNDIG